MSFTHAYELYAETVFTHGAIIQGLEPRQGQAEHQAEARPCEPAAQKEPDEGLLQGAWPA